MSSSQKLRREKGAHDFNCARVVDDARAERQLKGLVPGATPPSTPANAPDASVRSRARVVGVDPSVLRANGVMPADASGPVGHAFKMLRTQVLQRLRQRRWNTFAVISPSRSR